MKHTAYKIVAQYLLSRWFVSTHSYPPYCSSPSYFWSFSAENTVQVLHSFFYVNHTAAFLFYVLFCSLSITGMSWASPIPSQPVFMSFTLIYFQNLFFANFSSCLLILPSNTHTPIMNWFSFFKSPSCLISLSPMVPTCEPKRLPGLFARLIAFLSFLLCACSTSNLHGGRKYPSCGNLTMLSPLPCIFSLTPHTCDACLSLPVFLLRLEFIWFCWYAVESIQCFSFFFYYLNR